MEFDAYQQSYFADPQPAPRFDYAGLHGATLFYQDYAAAVDFYTQVFGPPAYLEGPHTRGWRLGDTWLTLLKGDGRPQHVEVALSMRTPAAAEAVQAAFAAAGGRATPPSDQLMYAPIRYCPATDPFGTAWLITAPLEAA
jgi:catechol 2,3-dioxygenase-like lactoylglutathione lyase family enzyme